MTQRFLQFVWLIAFSWLLACCSAKSAHAVSTKWDGETMGTTYTVKIAHDDHVDRSVDYDTVNMAIDAELRRVNDQMSTYLKSSELSQFNQAPTGEWFSVSKETAEIVDQAKQIHEQSGGAYDVTISPLVGLWNFGAYTSNTSTNELPSDELIAAALAKTGNEHLQVRHDPPALKKEIAELEVDLSSIAKGHGVDRVCEWIESQGHHHYMVEIGGEVRASGVRPDGRLWQIGIERPSKDGRELQTTVPLDNLSLATSGDYRIFYERNGKRYSHVINPKTGKPVEHRLASVTVVEDQCATADAFATTLLVMGPEKGAKWATQHEVAALFIIRQDSGNPFRIETTAAWDALYPEGKPKMISIFFIAAAIFAIAFLGLAIGVLMRGKCIQGSCGGLAGATDAGGNSICDSCTKPSPECSGTPEE